MDKFTGKLTILFEEPFWIGIFERIQNDKLSVSKVTFGAEPKDYDVFEFVMKHAYTLKYSPAIATTMKETKKNPKRMQREVKKCLQENGIGTKSQQALKLHQQQVKTESKIRKREQKEAEMARMFELKQQKKKEKHKGH